MRLTIFMGLLVMLTTGCVRSLPSTSHAHIGHSLTSWSDTPRNSGLFKVVEQEAQNAVKELKMAQGSTNFPCVSLTHVNNVVHSLNPQIQKSGSGAGYGVVRALQGTIEHINFAQQSEDASQNVIQSSQTFLQHAYATMDQILITLAAARRAASAHPTEIESYLPDLESSLKHSISGQDLDRDGVIGNLPNESGLLQLRNQLSTMVANEVDPTYQPIGEGSFLGLIPEPSNRWVNDFDKSGNLFAGW